MAAPGDPTAAALRAVLDSVFAAPAYRWADEPPLLRLLREWWHRLTGWLEGLRIGNPAAFRLFGFALLVLLVLVLAHGAWVVWRTVRGAATADDAGPTPAEREARDAAWFFRAADRAAGEGRTADAFPGSARGGGTRRDRDVDRRSMATAFRVHASACCSVCADMHAGA